MPADSQIFFGQGGQLRSGFGKQTLGKALTAPSCGFGSSTRDAGLKLYASAEHDKAKVKSSGGNQSQGAIYKVPVRCLSAVSMHVLFHVAYQSVVGRPGGPCCCNSYFDWQPVLDRTHVISLPSMPPETLLSGTISKFGCNCCRMGMASKLSPPSTTLPAMVLALSNVKGWRSRPLCQGQANTRCSLLLGLRVLACHWHCQLLLQAAILTAPIRSLSS